MYSSEFDGASLFSGGGFMPSQATQFNDSGFSPAKSRANQCTLQLTVKQISDADQASDDKSNFIIDGVDVNSVTLVGMVTNKVEKITDVNFTLDDGTGRIDIHRWVNDAAESNQLADVTLELAFPALNMLNMSAWDGVKSLSPISWLQLMNGIYVRVTGQLKGFQGKKQIVAFSVKPVTDFNEIAYHFIECIYVHLYNVKLQISGSVHPQTIPGMSNSFQNGPMGHQTPISNKFPGYLVDAGSDFDQMVLTIFHEPENLAKESGVHVDTIVERLGVPRNKVLASINYHTDNGNIYSTIDDYHYKSTING